MKTQSCKGKTDVVVFGSSLVKGLNESLLSKHGKNFKVFSHPGAHVCDITIDIKSVNVKGSLISCEDVKTVFLVCGGNDIENFPHYKPELHPLFEDYRRLFQCTKEVFPNAAINVISLIPRRTRYGFPHVHRMFDVNDWLRDYCTKTKMRFVDVYTFFLTKGNRYLNKKLFNSDLLHFSKTGDSVLGKVLIAVTYRPFKA